MLNNILNIVIGIPLAILCFGCMISFIVLCIIKIVRYICDTFHSLKEKKETNKNTCDNSDTSYNKKSNDEPSTAFYNAEIIQKKLHINGFQKLLCNDFKSELLNDSNLSPFKDLKKEEIKRKLDLFYISVLQYLKLSPRCNLMIDWSNYDKDNLENNSETGMFRHCGYKKEIIIKINKHMNFINAYSIICHESVHYFMLENNLNWLDIELNEQRTDIIAILIGFKNVLKQGYYYSFKDNSGLHNCKLGYISMKEIKDIEKIIEKYRKNIIKEEKQKESIKVKKEDIKKYADTIVFYMNQIEDIDKYYYFKTNKDSFNKIQEIYYEYECYDVKNKYILYLEMLEKSNDKKEIKKIEKELKILCEKLFFWVESLKFFLIPNNDYCGLRE